MKSKTDWPALQRESSEKLHKQALIEAKAREKHLSDALDLATEQRDMALVLRKQKVYAPILALGPVGESEATAFAIAGDWHAEETVDPRSVNGLNEYNLTIADIRVARFFQSVLKLTEIERHGTRIDNLVLCLLGDLMTGYIHEELQESNGLSPTETVLWLRKHIVAGLRLLLSKGNFKRIVVTCNYGNHGRNTKKIRHATGAKNSYEWMLYQVLRTDVPEVEWIIADGYFLFLDVYGRQFRIHHGDNVQYQGGIGGLTIPLEKAIAAWNKGKDVVPYLDIHGHHHMSMQSPRAISNGALIGYGAYALSIKAGFEHPTQTFFLLDSKRGRTGTFPIHVN